MELQKRIGIWDLDYYVGRRTLRWVGHVARMDKSRPPRRLLTTWVREPRPEFGQEMSYGHYRPGTGRVITANTCTNTLSVSPTPVFNATHAHREICHCVALFLFRPRSEGLR